ncbi:lipid II flippase MurJ [Aquabacterium sp.]|uniref:lipid II flippase MurJ n=1 Tax=Aquabacterium sp. TaxID=1872578 RepID=UPI003D6CA9F8
MLGSAGLLTLVTLLGLVAGLGREWLLVASWGAGARTDGFLIALFIPEAIRIILAGGLLSSAWMALYQERNEPERVAWLGRATFSVGLLGFALALVLSLGAPWWVRLVGPGLAPELRPITQEALRILAWTVPGLLLQALWSVPLQARGRFLLAGLSSLVYNLPVVIYLALHQSLSAEPALAWAFVAGGLATALLMVPAVRAHGLAMGAMRWHAPTVRELSSRIGPLLGSALMGQGLMLLERMVASYLGEGVVTVLNLARKLVNLPLVALMSVNQVLLGLMSKGGGADRLPLLRQGLALNTLVTTPAAVGLLLAAQAIVTLLFPKVQGTDILAPLLGWYAVALVLAGWNTLLARYNYAAGDTRLPFVCETSGNLAQAVTLPLLAWLYGAQGMAMALLLGVVVNGGLLLHFNRLWTSVRLSTLVLAGALSLGLSAAFLLPLWPAAPVIRLAASAGAGLCCLMALAAWLRPWKPVPA